MKRLGFIKKAGALFAAASMALALSGCMFVSSPDELYSLPKLPEEYTDLENEINALLSTGYEYIAPTEGENLQLVQMVDVDGDGLDEAVVFLRKSGDTKPLKIYIFKENEDGYQIAAEIQESAASIDRVDYQDMNGDGILELIVGWRIMNADPAQPMLGAGGNERTLARVVSVYNLERYEGQKILETSYNGYRITDLDRNGLSELIIIAGGNVGNCNATLYEWNLGALEAQGAARLSMSPAMLDDVREGGLFDGERALFVTGNVDEHNQVTDLLVLRDGVLTNCTMDEQTGISRLVYRNASIQARDINGDGVLELPISYELQKPSAESQTYWGIQWTAFSSAGEAHVVETTFHNLTDGWYLVLPESWKDTIMVTNVASTSGERAVTFGVAQGDDGSVQDILTIYTETGDNREYKASRQDRFVLVRQATTIYAAEFAEGSENWSGVMSERALQEAFHLIQAEWYLQ